jgi:hypothetical protein
MADSLFRRHREAKTGSTTPQELIEKEVAHLKKGTTARYGNKPRRNLSVWLAGLFVCALILLYIMDPLLHAWYKGEAVHAYVYLHNAGTGTEANELAGSGILRPEEVAQLNRSLRNYRDYYSTPQDAARTARWITSYMASVKTLHAGAYDNLNPLQRLRYELFMRTGLVPPISWDFLDPDVGS